MKDLAFAEFLSNLKRKFYSFSVGPAFDFSKALILRIFDFILLLRAQFRCFVSHQQMVDGFILRIF